MNYINKVINFMIKKSEIVRQDDLEKIIDTLLKIDENTVDSLYLVVEEVMKTDISKCIKEENIKYILEKSKFFFELDKQSDVENIVLQSKNVHEIINLVHREKLNNLKINYMQIITTITNGGLFDCEENKNILDHVVGMMKNYNFPLESYRELEKYLLVIHMELIPEYVKLNPKTNYKYIADEMNNKHASEEQIQEFKNNIKNTNNVFKKIIDSINYNKYKSK